MKTHKQMIAWYNAHVHQFRLLRGLFKEFRFCRIHPERYDGVGCCGYYRPFVATDRQGPDLRSKLVTASRYGVEKWERTLSSWLSILAVQSSCRTFHSFSRPSDAVLNNCWLWLMKSTRSTELVWPSKVFKPCQAKGSAKKRVRYSVHLLSGTRSPLDSIV